MPLNVPCFWLTQSQHVTETQQLLQLQSRGSEAALLLTSLQVLVVIEVTGRDGPIASYALEDKEGAST